MSEPDLKENILIWVKNVFNESSSNSSASSNKRTNRFEFLDAYRGSLALIVVVAHAKEGLSCIFLDVVGNLAQKYSISGFFLLSSFLLTYRLLKDLHKQNSSIILSVLKYFIRRFFRIYLVFALFVWLAIYGPEFFSGYTYGRYEEFWDILTLGYTGQNHLWTIAPEIKYYFLIPLICVCFYGLKNFAPILFGACLTWTVYDQLFNALRLNEEDIFSYSKKANLLKNHFSVFLLGSELAMALFIAETSERFMEWVKLEKSQKILNYSSLAIAFYGLIFHTETFNKIYDYKYRSRPGIFWSLSLFMALLNTESKNMIVNCFNKCEFLKSCGKFSFGMYLLHPAAIQFVFTFRFIVKLRLALVLSVFLSYIFGLIFYYVLEKHLIKLANYLCEKLYSLSNKHSNEIIPK